MCIRVEAVVSDHSAGIIIRSSVGELRGNELIDIFSREVSDFSKRKQFFRLSSKFFDFRVDQFPKGLVCKEATDKWCFVYFRPTVIFLYIQTDRTEQLV